MVWTLHRPESALNRLASGRVLCSLRPVFEALELYPCSKLHATEIISGFGYLTEASSTKPDVGEGKSLVIGHVEHLGANLQPCPLANLELFGQRHV